ncbi:btbpoz domain-containing protein [Nicotiana attenuata]|uniref:Btbpoz domain-containing protein n=1 Tax=Nicotiana attenuata TaxID=49451 RepID=A0A1J6JTI1_NICAT|nr:btbpoz domain-containing protein [Nicotiana attenuata]
MAFWIMSDQLSVVYLMAIGSGWCSQYQAGHQEMVRLIELPLVAGALWLMVWSWSDDERSFTDAIAIEERSSICIVNANECLGFIDMRSTATTAEWREKGTTMSGAYDPTLAFHQGQLFSSMNDRISVYCGSNWALTSTDCDFSIGGDRLFALHRKEDVIDIWETPRELYIPPKIDKKFLYREALYYGLLDHVRSAECDPFDGNRLRLAQSITGGSVGDDAGTTQAIRASPNGWCCVAQGSLVRVYDWMLEEQATINLDYRRVNDVCWVDSENIVASFDRKLDIGGIGLFNVSTGKLRYKHKVADQLEDYTDSRYTMF